MHLHGADRTTERRRTARRRHRLARLALPPARQSRRPPVQPAVRADGGCRGVCGAGFG